MNIKATTTIKNKYNVKCINERTGEVKHDLTFHNTVTNGIINVFQYYNHNYSSYPHYISIGNGTGTPAKTDTDLFSELKRFQASVGYSQVNNNTIKQTFSYTIPADSSNVYDITEIGIKGYGPSPTSYNSYVRYLITHALLLDSEGAPITIHKTDTDRVIITCELFTTFNLPNFDYTTMRSVTNGLSRCLNGGIWSTVGFTFSYAATADNENWATSAYISPNTAVTNSLGLLNYTYFQDSTNAKRNQSAGTISFNLGTLRLKEYTMPAYIKGVVINGLGAIKLPNENVFPRQKLEGISVGAGDGTNTEFKCPLNYFIKDTDTVYVNGVALTRGVDYTIDSDNNQDELVELSAGNDATITGGVIDSYNYNTSALYVPIFRRGISQYYAFGTSYSAARSRVSNTAPLYFDFGEPTKINTLRIAREKGNSRTYTLYGRNSTEDEWTQITSITHSTDNYRSKFDTVEYRYMQLTSSGSCYGTATTGTSGSSEHYDPAFNSLEKCENMLWFLGYVGEGIKFTTPPAEGALITMDAYTDLPFVSPNNVVDLSTDIVFQF